MTFIDAVKTCFVKYADFNGCASRPEFWWGILFTLIASIALQCISYNLSGAFSIATFLPGIAVTVGNRCDALRVLGPWCELWDTLSNAGRGAIARGGRTIPRRWAVSGWAHRESLR
jgi:hypothetical protein